MFSVILNLRLLLETNHRLFLATWLRYERAQRCLTSVLQRYVYRNSLGTKLETNNNVYLLRRSDGGLLVFVTYLLASFRSLRLGINFHANAFLYPRIVLSRMLRDRNYRVHLLRYLARSRNLLLGLLATGVCEPCAHINDRLSHYLSLIKGWSQMWIRLARYLLFVFRRLCCYQLIVVIIANWVSWN